jgi:tRNA(Ile)-lysidine synthase TilS/MesJ
MHERPLRHVVPSFENNWRQQNEEERRRIEKAFNNIDVAFIVESEIASAENESSNCESKRN